VWAYSKRRAARDNQSLTAQENRAQAVIAGEKPYQGQGVPPATHAGDAALDGVLPGRAKSLLGLNGLRHQHPRAFDGCR